MNKAKAIREIKYYTELEKVIYEIEFGKKKEIKMNNKKKYLNAEHRFIEEFLQTMGFYLDTNQHNIFYRLLELNDRVKDIENEIEELDKNHHILKDKQLNIEIELYETKKRTLNKEIQKKAVQNEFERILNNGK